MTPFAVILPAVLDCVHMNIMIFILSEGQYGQLYRARKSRTTLQNKVRLKVLPEQLTLFVNMSVAFKKCIIQ